MKITFLGTSSGAPSRHRNVSSLALQLPQQGTLWLFDCGEGTQHQILRSPLRLSQLEKVFLTHLHGDHLFGLIGLLATRSLSDSATTPVTLYGPAGLADYVRCAIETSRMGLRYPLKFETVTPDWTLEEETVTVSCRPMVHGIEAYAYAVVEKDQPGKFDADLAAALGIPFGPLYGRLKNGETIELPDGRVVVGSDLVGPPKQGRKLVLSGDTTYNQNLVALAQGADLLVHEATYSHADKPLADRARHSTATMAAQVAKQAGVRTLILTHFSARYELDGGAQMAQLLAEARAIFPNTLLAHDFFTYEIPRLTNDT